ncbi:MAG: isopenicillin N synthase family dioxygenase [Longimicrobiales bacterium]
MTKSIPFIDVSPLSGGDAEAVALTAELIGNAAREFGFFQVVGHRFPRELVDRMWGETRRFFDQPRTAKRAISRTKENPRGYYDRELTKNARDLKEVFDYAAVLHPELPEDHPDNSATVDGSNRWPPGLPAFPETMLEYYKECERLGFELLGALCLDLGLARDALFEHFAPAHTSFVRLNYYPLTDPLDSDEAADATDLGDMALHHHTDAGALTILLQDDVGGLQVLAGGDWIDVTPTPGAFVINVGDMMQVWSNDRYEANLHRVRPTKNRARYSIPCFFNPSYGTDYAPLTSDPDNPPHYHAINWGEFRQARTDGDYADFGREIQIADFRIA